MKTKKQKNRFCDRKCVTLCLLSANIAVLVAGMNVSDSLVEMIPEGAGLQNHVE